MRVVDTEFPAQQASCSGQAQNPSGLEEQDRKGPSAAYTLSVSGSSALQFRQPQHVHQKPWHSYGERLAIMPTMSSSESSPSELNPLGPVLLSMRFCGPLACAEPVLEVEIPNIMIHDFCSQMRCEQWER